MYLRAKDYFSDFEKVYGASGVLPSLNGADHFRLRKSMQSAYSRGTLDRSEKREAVAASSCDGLLHVHVCGPFLLPIFRWGIDSSSSFALSIWEGDRHGSQEEETHPAPLSTSAEGLAVKGVIMPRSGQTAVDREADEGRS